MCKNMQEKRFCLVVFFLGYHIYKRSVCRKLLYYSALVHVRFSGCPYFSSDSCQWTINNPSISVQKQILQFLPLSLQSRATQTYTITCVYCDGFVSSPQGLVRYIVVYVPHRVHLYICQWMRWSWSVSLSHSELTVCITYKLCNYNI